MAAIGEKRKGRCRNPEIGKGIRKYSRSTMYHKRGLWAIKAKHGGVFPKHEPQVREPKPDGKPQKHHMIEDFKKPFKIKRKSRLPKLRPSITPGTILILLAGRFMGKRVIFLKQLSSGLLLVTGPFKVNGVPLRRVSQAYVIATSTKIDISAVDVAKYDDDYFKREGKKKKKKTEEEFFEPENEERKILPQEKKVDQMSVDSQLMPIIETVSDLKAYLSIRFSLRAGMKPHELVF